MVGLVIVSHSARLAAGVVDLARQMGGDELRVEAAGGFAGEEGDALGTDPVRVQEAIERANAGDGVLVLMDLGSAVLSAETALELLEPDLAAQVRLTAAPLVEGAVAAGVAARGGADLEEVAAEARRGLAPKAAHLGGGSDEPLAVGDGPRPAQVDAGFVVGGTAGLHARPISRIVVALAAFDADVRLTNTTTGAGPASARSPTALGLLGVSRGHEVAVSATGTDAEAAVRALEQLARENFGDPPSSGDAVAASDSGTQARAAARFGEARTNASTADAAPSPIDAPSSGASPTAPLPAAPAALEPPAALTVLRGLAASPGLALGPARRLRGGSIEGPRGRAEDPVRERAAFEAAREAVGDELRAGRAALVTRAGEDQAAILDANLGLLDDPALLDRVYERIDAGSGAAAAAADTVAELGASYAALEDPYLRARASDIQDVGARLVRRSLGGAEPAPAITEPGVLLAPDLSPADTATLDPALVRGIATAGGGPTGHGAILARALGVPAVMGLGAQLLELADGTELALDGSAGTVVVAPEPAMRRLLEDQARMLAERGRAERDTAMAPALTRDGRHIEVMANIGSSADAERAVALGAEGVGLLRTEFLFADRATLPDECEQEAAYRAIAERMDGRPLTLRTLDVGADKPLRALPQPPEANPFLGARGVRLSLLEPELLLAQLRAALRVAADHPLRVMLPMVATLDELRAARALLERAKEQLTEEGASVPAKVELGIMVEVPAAALAAPRLAAEADFFSLGTNDLSQYVMAAERGNPRVADLADGLQPAVLALIRMTVEAADAAGRRVAVCGELAADPLAIALLVGLGVHELSVSPPAVPGVKRVLRELDFADARKRAQGALEAASAVEVRSLARVASGHAANP